MAFLVVFLVALLLCSGLGRLLGVLGGEGRGRRDARAGDERTEHRRPQQRQVGALNSHKSPRGT
ncbi:hypothetical protein ACQP1P_33945 [Dactylosporangium sp. CA-052675]|uniref:hypothetical protein n=1 Tax=Dactylosporangium sp. CA-052675 TaxID=3239927 RepID=UPI003D8F288C